MQLKRDMNWETVSTPRSWRLLLASAEIDLAGIGSAPPLR